MANNLKAFNADSGEIDPLASPSFSQGVLRILPLKNEILSLSFPFLDWRMAFGKAAI